METNALDKSSTYIELPWTEQKWYPKIGAQV